MARCDSGSPPLPFRHADELQVAWAEANAATPNGWYVGRPSEHPEPREWVMFAFDTRERAIEGKRTGEWMTVAPPDLEVGRSIAYCLRELGPGRSRCADTGCYGPCLSAYGSPVPLWCSPAWRAVGIVRSCPCRFAP